MTIIGTQWWITLLVAVAASMGAATACGAADDTTHGRIRIPGTDYDLAIGGRVPPSVGPDPKLVHAIAVWLAREFALSPIDHDPTIRVVSSEVLTSLRYRGVFPTDTGNQDAVNGKRSADGNIVAVYSDRDETIYLSEGWGASVTPTGVSVLVHEMVHHLQHVLGLRHECPQHREQLAYEAQERWLGLFGHSLETDFKLDGFSLLGKTRCFF
jgi:hypothetical protein